MEVSVIQVLNFSHSLLSVAYNKVSLTWNDDGIVINVEKSYEFKSQSTLAKLCFFQKIEECLLSKTCKKT